MHEMKYENCPIRNVLSGLGDKWSLLILRDLMFSGKQSYSELQNSDEKVATNILSSRLEQLEKDGLISKRPDLQDRRKKIYALTEAGQDMLPIMLEMMVWSDKYDPETNVPKPFIERIKLDRFQVIKDLLARHQDDLS